VDIVLAVRGVSDLTVHDHLCFVYERDVDVRPALLKYVLAGLARRERVCVSTMPGAASAAIDDFAGGTRLGESLTTLRLRHARRLVGRRTLVLLVSDGLDTGEPEALTRELDWLRLHSRRLLWLNPLLRFDGYAPIARGAAVLHRQADAMVAVHNLSALEQLATSLAALMRKG